MKGLIGHMERFSALILSGFFVWLRKTLYSRIFRGMHLKRLEIQGFKTFAQKTNFVFVEPKDGSGGLTVIVGPNGSGSRIPPMPSVG